MSRDSRWWTEEETEFLTRNYAKYGPSWVGEKLGRSRSSTYQKAKLLGIAFGEIDGWAQAHLVAKTAGVTTANIIELAQAAGALRVVGPPRKNVPNAAKRVLVRERWADEYLRERRERLDNETAGYLTSREAMAVLGLGRAAFERALQGVTKYTGGIIGAIRKVRGKRGRWLFNPHDVEQARARMAGDRQRARRMVSVKSLAVDEGIDPTQVFQWMTRKGIERHHAVLGGRLQTFISPADADSYRARRRQRVKEEMEWREAA